MRSIYFGLIYLFFALPCLAQTLRVNQDRLEASILKLATFGQNEDGTTNRVAYSDADIAGRSYVMNLMKEANLDVSIDYAGNIIGRRSGSNKALKPLVFGSHIDMVPNGGNYDGCVGSMGAIEVMNTLHENQVPTKHPLELIIFTDEEGGLVGSRALAGLLTAEALKVVNSTGYTVEEGINRLGGNTTKLNEVSRKTGDMAAFLELHIEQGGLLEQANLDIGVVEGIVGIKWWDVEFTGFANHAGTTPMNMRQDALLAASEFVLTVNEIVNSFEGKHVGTVGRIKALPGAPNVIPGKVVLSLEIRDLSSEKIADIFKRIEESTQKISEKNDIQIEFKPIDATAKPAITDKNIQEQITKAAQMLDLSFQQMQSGAGHDAQDMARLAPTGMIFVPSKGGISHSPNEFTSAEDMANGANVLLQTLLLLDNKNN